MDVQVREMREARSERRVREAEAEADAPGARAGEHLEVLVLHGGPVEVPGALVVERVLVALAALALVRAPLPRTRAHQRALQRTQVAVTHTSHASPHKLSLGH